MKRLEQTLRDVRATGRKALVPYFMAGTTPDWRSHVHAAVQAGADAVEIGIPFSDPLMDGPVIQAAGLQSLGAGTTLSSVCADLASEEFGVPLIVMTYYNLFHHEGEARSIGRLVEAGITGAIVPDLTLEESGSWRSHCDEADLATIFMVAPSTTPDRFISLTTATEGFCYASARMAVTGKAQGSGDAQRVVDAVRAVSDVPVYVGIGITTPSQAADAATHSDGVIVGSALVDRILKGASASDVESFVGEFRAALDQLA
jgi:tryptophan synthase alpha chain